MEYWWNDTDKGKPKDPEKKKSCPPVPLRPTQIPDGLAWNGTWAPELRSLADSTFDTAMIT